MKFYFDEAGNFAIPTTQRRHCIAVVVGVAVTDSARDSLAADYAAFARGLDPNETRQGEPKGKDFTVVSLDRFIELLAQRDGVLVTPVTIDLGALVTWPSTAPVSTMRSKLTDLSRQALDPAMHEHIQELAVRVGKLSYQQFLRLLAWEHCIMESLRHAVIFLSAGKHAASWSNVSYEIDRVQERVGNEQFAFSTLLPAWMAAQARDEPITTVREIHTSDHPFVREFCLPNHKIDIGKLVGNRVEFVDSTASWGVQVADICTAIVHRAAKDLNNKCGAVTRFAKLMRCSGYGPRRGPGLFIPAPVVDAGTISNRYRILSDAMSEEARMDTGQM